MKSGYILGVSILLAAFTGCKKDAAGEGAVIAPFRVDKLSNLTVQSGVTITIYGSGLQQQDRLTEVFFNNRPAEITQLSADSITAIIPENTYSGKVLVTISRGEQFSSVYGPDVTVRPTPKIKSFAPVYAFGGQTIELYTENFSADNADNEFIIDGKIMTVTGRKGQDTFLVTVPETASSAAISYRTYSGPSHSTTLPFRVRKRDYGVQTVREWLTHDPAFSYTDTLVKGYPVLAGGNYDLYKRTYDSALNYMQSAGKTYTIILPSDQYFAKVGTSKDAYIQEIKNRPYNYNNMLIAAVLPGVRIELDKVDESSEYSSAYSELMQWYPAGSDAIRNTVKFVTIDGEKYAQMWGLWGEFRTPVKVLNEIHIGNATILEVDGELGFVPF